MSTSPATRGGIYSGRPHLTMLSDLMGSVFDELRLFLLSDSRPLAHDKDGSGPLLLCLMGLNGKPVENCSLPCSTRANRNLHEPQELKAARIFLLKLYETPENFDKLLRKMAGSAILSVAYANDGFVIAAVPGTYLVLSSVGLFLVVKIHALWMPGASFKRQARIWKNDMEKSLHGPFDSTKRSMIEGGSLAPCFAEMDNESLIEKTAATMYIGTTTSAVMIITAARSNVFDLQFPAGTDTTVITILSFILAMIKWPEYQRKAQEELDPIVNEVLRWQPVTPLAFAHQCTEEDMYNGYRIPKNSTVLPNVWAMFHDEKNFADPYTFNPDRYIRATDRQLNPDVLEPTAGFGFGRRICPGMHMGLSEVWITVASMLAVYDISNALDEKWPAYYPDWRLHITACIAVHTRSNVPSNYDHPNV
ncbi:cytochrome P450 [Gymnopus androsaceus JB14]|uniref:Cytochrome P450 n=1 Tax=Gymnopus androsaceus JB14 TaxID=1447944 RepID=A0A6A4HNB9_9AGAR|nr:cytochrome P450 [Gymnopus androsaceus JB14]